MSDSAFFLGYPVEFKKICFIYPPKIKDIVTIKEFGIYRRLLTFSQEEIEDEYVKAQIELKNILTPLEYLLSNAFKNKELRELTERAFTFFIHEPVIILFETKRIIVGEITEVKSLEELRCIDESNFFDFQNLVRESVGDKAIEPPNPNEHWKIKQMKAKARYRDQIKAKQSSLTLKSALASICCMQFGLNPLNIGELSYSAMGVLMDKYREKESYETDIRSLQAGADSKKIKPKYWIN